MARTRRKAASYFQDDDPMDAAFTFVSNDGKRFFILERITDTSGACEWAVYSDAVLTNPMHPALGSGVIPIRPGAKPACARAAVLATSTAISATGGANMNANGDANNNNAKKPVAKRILAKIGERVNMDPSLIAQKWADFTTYKSRN